MIEIITPGIINYYTHTCPYCGCVYKYTYEDVVNYGLSYLGNSYVICPCCHQHNSVWNYGSPLEQVKDGPWQPSITSDMIWEREDPNNV